MCVCVCELYVCVSAHEPVDFDVLVPKMSRWKTTIRDR